MSNGYRALRNQEARQGRSPRSVCQAREARCACSKPRRVAVSFSRPAALLHCEHLLYASADKAGRDSNRLQNFLRLSLAQQRHVNWCWCKAEFVISI